MYDCSFAELQIFRQRFNVLFWYITLYLHPALYWHGLLFDTDSNGRQVAVERKEQERVRDILYWRILDWLNPEAMPLLCGDHPPTAAQLAEMGWITGPATGVYFKIGLSDDDNVPDIVYTGHSNARSEGNYGMDGRRRDHKAEIENLNRKGVAHSWIRRYRDNAAAYGGATDIKYSAILIIPQPDTYGTASQMVEEGYTLLFGEQLFSLWFSTFGYEKYNIISPFGSPTSYAGGNLTHPISEKLVQSMLDYNETIAGLSSSTIIAVRKQRTNQRVRERTAKATPAQKKKLRRQWLKSAKKSQAAESPERKLKRKQKRKENTLKRKLEGNPEYKKYADMTPEQQFKHREDSKRRYKKTTETETPSEKRARLDHINKLAKVRRDRAKADIC